MKVFVSTKKGQGARSNDFCFVPEGELVHFTFECGDEGSDGPCGCKRAMSGMLCHTATTTFTVADVAMTKKEYGERLFKTYEESGWVKLGMAKSDIDNEAKELLRMAKLFKTGAVLEKRDGFIKARRKLKKK